MPTGIHRAAVLSCVSLHPVEKLASEFKGGLLSHEIRILTACLFVYNFSSTPGKQNLCFHPEVTEHQKAGRASDVFKS